MDGNEVETLCKYRDIIFKAWVQADELKQYLKSKYVEINEEIKLKTR